WQSRVSSHFRDAAPRLVDLPTGKQAWQYEDIQVPINIAVVRLSSETTRDNFSESRLAMSIDEDKTHRDPSRGSVRYDEIRPGCYDPRARLDDLDLDGIWADLSFPTFARFAGHRFLEGSDRELSLECVRAYNDFLADEWCAANPRRLNGV